MTGPAAAVALTAGDLAQLAALLARAGIAAPGQVFTDRGELVAALEQLARTLAAARLALALEQGARDQVRQLARQADEVLRRPPCGSCRLAGEVLRSAHACFGERRPPAAVDVLEVS